MYKSTLQAILVIGLVVSHSFVQAQLTSVHSFISLPSSKQAYSACIKANNQGNLLTSAFESRCGNLKQVVHSSNIEIKP